MRVTVAKAFKGTRPFKCAYCEKTFWDRDSVIKHEQMRHSKRLDRDRREWSKANAKQD